MAVGGIVLFAVTWKLWTPQTDFPQIPFSVWLVDVPAWVDWVGLAGIAAGLAGLTVSLSQKLTTISISCFVVATLVLVALNQHRLQPWVYLLLVYCGYLLTFERRVAVKWVRWTVASVYVFSAVSKFDYQFVFTVGQQMLETLCGFIALDTGDFAVGTSVALVLVFPLSEFLVGILLLIPKTRHVAGWLAMAMHGTLVLVLGPMGLDHQLGVLAWNCFFICQAWVLFVGETSVGKTKQKRQEGTELVRQNGWVGNLVGVFVLIFPATCLLLPQVELPVRADHWVAWEVYAPRSSRASFAVESQTIKKSLGELSLARLGVPVYPQARFQAACLVEIGTSGEGGGMGLRGQPILISETSSRMTGRRQTERLDSQMAWQRYCDRQWLNLIPRGLGR